MEDFSELIRRQTRYGDLVVWLQEQEHCTYLEACLKINELLRQYRSRYAT